MININLMVKADPVATGGGRVRICSHTGLKWKGTKKKSTIIINIYDSDDEYGYFEKEFVNNYDHSVLHQLYALTERKKSCLWSFSDFLHIRASDRDTITQWEKFINVKPLDSFPWDIFNLLPIAPLKLMIKNNNKIQNKRSKLANIPFSYFIYFIFNLWRNLCIYIKY